MSNNSTFLYSTFFHRLFKLSSWRKVTWKTCNACKWKYRHPRVLVCSYCLKLYKSLFTKLISRCGSWLTRCRRRKYRRAATWLEKVRRREVLCCTIDYSSLLFIRNRWIRLPSLRRSRGTVWRNKGGRKGIFILFSLLCIGWTGVGRAGGRQDIRGARPTLQLQTHSIYPVKLVSISELFLHQRLSIPCIKKVLQRKMLKPTKVYF